MSFDLVDEFWDNVGDSKFFRGAIFTILVLLAILTIFPKTLWIQDEAISTKLDFSNGIKCQESEIFNLLSCSKVKWSESNRQKIRNADYTIFASVRSPSTADVDIYSGDNKIMDETVYAGHSISLDGVKVQVNDIYKGENGKVGITVTSYRTPKVRLGAGIILLVVLSILFMAGYHYRESKKGDGG